MELSSSSAKASDPHSNKWASFIGTTVALLTLTIPLLAISYYSSPNSDSPLQNTSLTSSVLPQADSLQQAAIDNLFRVSLL